MLYIKNEGEFYRIRDDNFYVFCDRCGEMIPIPDPAGYFYELGASASSLEVPHLCDHCMDVICMIEEMVLAARRASKPNQPGAVKEKHNLSGREGEFVKNSPVKTENRCDAR